MEIIKMGKMTLISILLIYSWLSITVAFVENTRTNGEGPVKFIGQRSQCGPMKEYDFITEYKRLPEQRYVTEYKRFPEYRYSFGIGKRWLDDTNIKRTLPYSFGVGKRSQLEKFYPMKFLTDYTANNNENYFNNDEIIDDTQNKRDAPLRPYNFGIGKRNKIRDELDGLHSTDYNIDMNERGKQKAFDMTNKILNGAEQILEQY